MSAFAILRLGHGETMRGGHHVSCKGLTLPQQGWVLETRESTGTSPLMDWTYQDSGHKSVWGAYLGYFSLIPITPPKKPPGSQTGFFPFCVGGLHQQLRVVFQQGMQIGAGQGAQCSWGGGTQAVLGLGRGHVSPNQPVVGL